jgi:hypothetical protein
MTWVDRAATESPIALDDLLIIAPHNAQVFRASGAHTWVSHRHRRQVSGSGGQEAPIVIYSMSTSSHADTPRGMEFLYSANRLNVATSRAQCLCIVVASPRLFEAECRTPRQMQLASACCRYWSWRRRCEMADGRRLNLVRHGHFGAHGPPQGRHWGALHVPSCSLPAEIAEMAENDDRRQRRFIPILQGFCVERNGAARQD